jgi:hypothetical protein
MSPRTTSTFCPAGEQLTYCCTNEEDGKTLSYKTLSYWTTACGTVNPLSGLPCAWTGFLFAAITAVTFRSQYSIFFRQIDILPELHCAANFPA